MGVWAAAGVLCVAALLVACSPDPEEPTPLPPVETTSPSPVALAIPSEAAAETPQGAAAFARYYFDVLETALSDGETGQLRTLSDAACETCSKLIGAAEDVAAKQQTVRDAGFVVEYAEAPPIEDGEVVVALRYARNGGALLDANGGVVEEIAPEAAVDAQMLLRRIGVAWRVLGLRQVSS